MENMKYKFIGVAMTLFMILMSCQKEFIELLPTDTATVDDVYKNDNDFNDAVNGCYAGLMDPYESWWCFGDMRGDDSWDELGKSNSNTYFDLFIEDVNDGRLSTAWRQWYVVISRANTLLSKINDVDVSIVPNKDRYVAETKFIRALTYFNLVRIFGDVPMITVPVTPEEAYIIPREPLANIYNQVIIPDLLEAENKLPVSYSGNLLGKATRGAAKSLLGHVYLTTKDFVKAEAKFQEVTTMGYALLSEYKDLFDYSKEEHHSEYIFDIEYITGGLGLGTGFANDFCPKEPALLAFFKLVGQGGDGTNSPPLSFFDLFPPGDKRKDISIADGWTDNDGVYHFLGKNSNRSSTYTMKYLLNLNMATVNDCPANWKVYRYADVLLMLAEAMNENGKTDQALTYLNQVRTRAGLTGYSGLTQAEARDSIALERRLELCFEGKRWFDLVRTGKALEVMAPLGMREHNTIWAVPQNQIDLYNNPEIFWQNEGYE